MRRTRWFIGTLAVVGSIVLIGAALPAGSQPPQQRNTVTLFDPNRTNYDKFVDVGRKGFSPGDNILFVDAQFDPETCERVAKLIGRLQVSKVIGDENAWVLGEFTLKFADGKLVAAGAARFGEFAQTEKAVFAVTGGTDAYRDASGDVRFQEDVEMCGRKGTLTTIDLGPAA